MDYLLFLAFVCLFSPSGSSTITFKKGSTVAAMFPFLEVYNEDDTKASWNSEAFYFCNFSRWCVYKHYTLESDFNVKRIHWASYSSGDSYYFNKPAIIESNQDCLIIPTRNFRFYSSYMYNGLQMKCWNRSYKGQNKCPEYSRRSGNTWGEMCESFGGCKYNHWATPASSRCYDACVDYEYEWDCLRVPGCGFDRETMTCFAADSEHHRISSATELEQDTCIDVELWHDSSGSNYDCEWYESFPQFFCAMFGDYNRNYGYVANEACCVCKERLNRRALGSRLTGDQEEENSVPEPKVGFLHKGGVLSGVARENWKRMDVEYVKPIVKKGLRALEDSCEEFNWWDADTHTFENDEILCPEGKAVGTLFQSGIMFGTGLKEYSLQTGYCCNTPATISTEDCEWRPVNQEALGNYACNEDEVLTGFKLSHFTIDVDHIADIRCCAYLEITEEE